MLAHASALGLSIPKSLVTNDCDVLGKFRKLESIVKPLNGGGLCQDLEKVIASTPARAGCTAQPAIVQERIPGPDLRVYGVGDQLFAFNLESPSLDYRELQDATITQCDVPSVVRKSLLQLMAQLDLDWFAADFKIPSVGAPVFLEVNSNPMFSVFDVVSKGALTSAMLDQLHK